MCHPELVDGLLSNDKDDYVLSAIATIKLPLRRTLVRSVLYSAKIETLKY